MAPVWLVGVALLLSGTALAADDAALEEAWSKARQGVRSAARETGHAFRDVAKATGETAQRGAREVGHATRDAAEEVGGHSESAWERASRSVAEAFESLAQRLRELREDRD